MLPTVFINLDRDLARERLYSPALNVRTHSRPLVDGEKGCYASHLRAAEHLLDGEAPAQIVLEDDVALSDVFGEVVNAVARLPVGWDIVKFNSRVQERPWAARVFCPGHELIAYRRVPSMGIGCALSRRGAGKMLARRVPFGRPVEVDFRYWWECEWPVSGVPPGVVTLSEHASQNSIWAQCPLVSWEQRWRKWLLQVEYSFVNSVQRQKQTCLPDRSVRQSP